MRDKIHSHTTGLTMLLAKSSSQGKLMTEAGLGGERRTKGNVISHSRHNLIKHKRTYEVKETNIHILIY
jgi:hypothetical protein